MATHYQKLEGNDIKLREGRELAVCDDGGRDGDGGRARPERDGNVDGMVPGYGTREHPPHR